MTCTHLRDGPSSVIWRTRPGKNSGKCTAVCAGESSEPKLWYDDERRMISDSSPNSGWLSTSSLLLSISVGRLFGSPPNSSYHNPCSRMRYYGKSQKKKKKKNITACDIIFCCTYRSHCIEWFLPLAYCSWRLFLVYASSDLPYWECSICARQSRWFKKKNHWNMNRELHSCSSVYNYNNRGDSNLVSIGL